MSSEVKQETLNKCKINLKPPDEFVFPFPPYKIQHDFMKSLYQAIENGKLGIFESPTGTGKSLSILCGALAWLKDHERREKDVLESAIRDLTLKEESNTGSSDDWISAECNKLKNKDAKVELQLDLNKLSKKEAKIESIRKKASEGKKKGFNDFTKKSSNDSVQSKVANELPSDLIKEEVDEYDLLLEEVSQITEDQVSDEDEEEKEEEYQGVQIIFCSRTHSQLTQFINELKRTEYNIDTRLVPLASRQSYCINKTVRKLNSVTLINERCLELQKGKNKVTKKSDDGETMKKSKGSGCCPHLKGTQTLAEDIITYVQDVEELVNKANKSGSCPYYASRQAVPNAQVVVVPYNTLLHKSTREACGLRIDGNVVIVDEAHNLLETISHIHSVEITGQQLSFAYSQLTQYRDRYEKRFSATNLLHLKQLIYIIGNLIKLLGGKPGCDPKEATSKILDSKLMTTTEFIISAEIDTFNLYKLLKIINLNKLPHKLYSFAEHYSSNVGVVQKPEAKTGIKAFLQEITNQKNIKGKSKAVPEPSSTSEEKPKEENEKQGQPLVGILAFLEALTRHESDGRVLINRQLMVGKSTYKYVLLNPAPAFKDIVQKARSVILCGGTMQPISEFKDQLFEVCGASPERIQTFSCSHVIPPENILPIILCSGPSGLQLDFSYQSRSKAATINEIGRILTNVCNIVPAGIVCFFPSYDYENTVYQHLEKSGALENISRKKKVFREPKKSGQADNVLSDFAKVIQNCKGSTKINGAVLLSVVGGKLSEGLNFSDDLGRCVLVVGMPYPNIKSPELQEKISYLNNNVSPSAGKVHYENLCMKAVNQSIGRAVRHKNDYSTVLLLDYRYSRNNTQAMLPSWMASSLQVHPKFGPALAQLVKFFKHHSPST